MPRTAVKELILLGSSIHYDYYVSTTGSDSNDGLTPATAWLTLQKAETAGATGKVVGVYSGVYVENDATTHAWNVSKGITWLAIGGTVTVHGNAAGIRILNITIGSGAATWNGFFFDGEGAKSNVLIMQAGGNNKTFINCTFSGGTTQQIAPSGGTVDNANFINCTVTGAGTNAIFVNSGTAFTNSTFNGCTLGATAGTVIRVAGTGTTLTITNCTINISGTATLGFSTIINGTYTLSGNTFNASAGIAVSAATGTGTLSLTGNTFNITANLAAISVLTGVWATTLTSNTINSTFATQTTALIQITNQLSPILTLNTIETQSTSDVTHIQITSSGTDCGTVQVKNNTFKTRSQNGYTVLIGSDTSTAGDGKINGAQIESNTRRLQHQRVY